MPTVTARLITVVEAAEIIGLSRSKVYELLADGELPSIRIGRTRRIDTVDLDAFIDRHRTPTTSSSIDAQGPETEMTR